MRPVRKILQIVSVLLPSVLLGSVVFAAVLHVPADYATVTEALRRASAGDTVQLAAGVYRESVEISFPLTWSSRARSRASGEQDTRVSVPVCICVPM